jgi:hypothetical protein
MRGGFKSMMFSQKATPRAGACAVVVLLIAMVLTPVASGHRAFPNNGQDFKAAYPNQGYYYSHENVQWWFESSFPGASGEDNNKRRAVIRGSQAWTNLNRRLTFVNHGSTELDFPAPYSEVRPIRTTAPGHAVSTTSP